MALITESAVRQGQKLVPKTLPESREVNQRKHNRLLARLPATENVRLLSHLQPAWLDRGEILIAAGVADAPIYFPTTAIISQIHNMADGSSCEVAMIGYEGLAGMFLTPGAPSPHDFIVQSPGFAYRVKSAIFFTAISMSPALGRVVAGYASSLITQMSFAVAEARYATIEAKMCRWLLDRRDRSPDDELKVTQELVSLLLGVRRETVTATARKLQEAGAICYRRGQITIIDRAILEQTAGECYSGARF